MSSRISLFDSADFQFNLNRASRAGTARASDAMEKALKPGGPAHLGLGANVVQNVVLQSAIKANALRDQYALQLLKIVESYQSACALADAAKGTLGEKAALDHRAKVRATVEYAGKTEVRESYRAQWRAGKDSGGNLAELKKEERDLLDRLIRTQYAFFVNMLHDIEEGTGKMPIPRRVSQYAQCSAEAYWAGMVLSDLSAGVYYKWTLGNAEHCADCLKLGTGGRWAHTDDRGTFSAKELASMGVFPQSGRLACCTYCKCGLHPCSRPSATAKGGEWLSLDLEGPGSSSFEGEDRSDRSHLVARKEKAKWLFRGRMGKSLAALLGVSRETPATNDGPTPHEFGSTQLDLPFHEAEAFKQFAWSHIADGQLAPDGFESDLHVTAKFGVIPPSDDVTVDLFQLCFSHAPITIETGPVGIFRHAKDYDVVFVEVESPTLRMLHREIEAQVECKTDDFPYKPHITLAYVTKGSADGLEGSTGLAGRSIQFDSLTLSSRERVKTVLPFHGVSLPVDNEDAPVEPSVVEPLVESFESVTTAAETAPMQKAVAQKAVAPAPRTKRVSMF